MVILMLVALALPSIAAADVFIRQVRWSPEQQVMGQTMPAREDTMTIWLSDVAGRMNGAENLSTVIRQDKDVLYVLDHGKKQYASIPMDALGDMDKMAILSGDKEAVKQTRMMLDQMKQMMASLEVTVSKTDEVDTIRGWTAQKYVLSVNMPMGSTTTELWATTDVEANTGLYRRVGASFLAMMPGLNKVLAELSKVEGITVMSLETSKMMGNEHRSTMEVVEMTTKDAPDGAFDIPENYAQADPLDMLSRLGSR
jgi:hypothetical protein